MISQLVFDLPATERYRLLLMERDLDEVLASQEKMLARLGRPALPRDKMKVAFAEPGRPLQCLAGEAADISRRCGSATRSWWRHPAAEAARINAFLGGELDVAAMAAAVDPTLYRNRKTA